jgi:hypothetical protein
MQWRAEMNASVMGFMGTIGRAVALLHLESRKTGSIAGPVDLTVAFRHRRNALLRAALLRCSGATMPTKTPLVTQESLDLKNLIATTNKLKDHIRAIDVNWDNTFIKLMFPLAHIVETIKDRIEAIEKHCETLEKHSTSQDELATALLADEIAIEGVAYDLFVRWAMSPGFMIMCRKSRLEFEVEALKNLDELIKQAITGQAAADYRLRVFAFGFIMRGRRLPVPLAEYVCKILVGKGPKLKRGRHNSSERDQRIVEEIQLLIENGYSAERACLTVSKALGRLKRHISKDAVAKIWTRRKHRARLMDKKPINLSNDKL